jgi:cysteine-rich repeat protein
MSRKRGRVGFSIVLLPIFFFLVFIILIAMPIGFSLCQDANACNFGANAECIYYNCPQIYGCTDANACNYNPSAEVDDGNCEFTSCINPILGCTDGFAINYHPFASQDDGSCLFCGNSIKEVSHSYGSYANINEQCDDGNQNDGDGCSSTCQIESQPILRLSAFTGAFAQTADFTNYPIIIDYVTLFGSAYVGDNPYLCTGSNEIVRLSSETASLGSNITSDYPIPVCFGDLVCQHKFGSCNVDAGETFLFSMSANQSGLFSIFDTYDVSVCCSLGAICGNGNIEGSEQCDDGNQNDGDGCSSTCELESYCGDNQLDAGEECDFGESNGQGFVSSDQFLFNTLSELQGTCNMQQEFACSNTCVSTNRTVSVGEFTQLKAHSFLDLDRNGLSDDTLLGGSYPLNNLNISLYRRLGLGNFEHITSSVTQTNYFQIPFRISDAYFGTIVDPQYTYFFVIDTESENYNSLFIERTISGGDSVGILDGDTIVYQIPLMACKQQSTPEFGFVTRSFCGDGNLDNPNSFGFYEECDDGNNVDGDGCSALCTLQDEPLYCGENNQTILRFNGVMNAFAEHPAEENYPISIDFDTAFGFTYTGYNACACTGENRVISLTGLTNALGSNSTYGYPVDICYGNLVCTQRSVWEGGCRVDEGEVELFSMTGETNAFFAISGAGGSYNTRVCCTAQPDIPQCGNGKLEVGEQCDFGPGRNNNLTYSANPIRFVPWVSDNLCSEEISYVCNSVCSVSEIIIEKPGVEAALEYKVFMDANENADDDDSDIDSLTVLENLDVALVMYNEEGDLVEVNSTQLSTLSGQFSRTVYPQDEIFFAVDTKLERFNTEYSIRPSIYGADNQFNVIQGFILTDYTFTSCVPQNVAKLGFVPFVAPECGDGILDLGEQCDYKEYNDGGSTSRNQKYYYDFITPQVCGVYQAYTCSNQCSSSTETIVVPNIDVQLQLFVFSDYNRDNQFSSLEGLSGVSVSLYKDGDLVGVTTSLAEAGLLGYVSFNTDIYPNSEYWFEIDPTDEVVAALVLALNKTNNPLFASNASLVNGMYRVPIDITQSSCQPTQTFYAGFVSSTQPTCGNGQLEVGEVCDFGTVFGTSRNDGIFASRDIESYVEPLRLTCSIEDVYTCSACLVSSQSTLSTPAIISDARVRLFNDTNGDSSSANEPGVSGITISLIEEQNGGQTLLQSRVSATSGFPQIVSNNLEGVGVFTNIEIYPDKTYWYSVDRLSDELRSTVLSDVKVGTNDAIDSDAIEQSGQFLIELPISQCQIQGILQMGLRYPTVTCGNGVFEPQFGETCDFGIGANDNVTVSNLSGTYRAFIPPTGTCLASQVYVCNSLCQQTMYTHVTDPAQLIISARVFNDTNKNGNFNGNQFSNEGIHNVTVHLERNGTLLTQLGGKTSNAQNAQGMITFVTEFVKGASYNITIDMTQEKLLGFKPTINKTDNPVVNSNASLRGSTAFAPVVITNVCSPIDLVYLGFIQDSCGNGVYEPLLGEQCDFGSGRNNVITRSLTQTTFNQFNDPSVCQTATAFTCSATCQSGTVLVETPATTSITGRVFNDSNFDGNFAVGEGLGAFTVELLANGNVVATATSSTSTQTRGLLNFNTQIYPNRTYTLTISTQQLTAGGYSITTNKTTNPLVQSNLSLNASYAFIPVHVTPTCTVTDTYFMGLRQVSVASCGNGQIDIGEQCDFGSFNGLWSSSNSTYLPWVNPEACLSNTRHMCSNTCQVVSEQFTQPCINQCNNNQFVACSINGTAEYAQGITYAPVGILQSGADGQVMCVHNGSSWGFMTLVDGLEGLAIDNPEICAGGANSIDQNCNAYEFFERDAEGRIDYTQYKDADGQGTVFIVKKNVDAFDPACFANGISGTVSSASGSIVGATVELYIISDSGVEQLFRTTTSGAGGSYAIGAIPATSYRLVVSANGFVTQLRNIELTYNNPTLTQNFVLVSGLCNSDCTTTANPGVCSAGCEGINGCVFHNATIATFLDGKAIGNKYYNSALDVTVTACMGPVENGYTIDPFETTPLTVSGITCPSGTSLVVSELVVLYNGEPVKLVMPVCRVS